MEATPGTISAAMYQRVVIPLDGSPIAESILPFISKIAGPLDMEVILIRVVPLAPEQVMGIASTVGIESVEAGEREAQRYLGAQVEELWAKGLRAQAQVVIGDPASEIVACARKVGADLIAMTTHGRSGLSRLVMGSVAEQVLHLAAIPVFLMRMVQAASASPVGAEEKRA